MYIIPFFNFYLYFFYAYQWKSWDSQNFYNFQFLMNLQDFRYFGHDLHFYRQSSGCFCSPHFFVVTQSQEQKPRFSLNYIFYFILLLIGIHYTLAHAVKKQCDCGFRYSFVFYFRQIVKFIAWDYKNKYCRECLL